MNVTVSPPAFTTRRLASALVAAFFLAACGDGDQPTAPEAKAPTALQAIGSDPVTGATLETNKDDYLPGEVVHLKGTGWAPGETIDLHMTEEPDTHGPIDQTVDADSTGAFSMHFYDVQQHDLGSTFTLTGTGRVSGSKATVVFTDGNIKFLTSPVSLIATLTYSRFNGTATCSGSPASTNNSLAYNTNLGLQDNQSIQFAIPVVPGKTYTGYSAPGMTVSPASASSNTTLCVAGLSGSNSGTITLNYDDATVTTTTTVAASPTPSSAFGQQVTFTATVTPASGPAATGTVKFYEFTGAQSCTNISGSPELASDNSAPFEYTTSALSVGAHTISACYTPNTGWSASGGSTAHTVDKAAPNVALADSPAGSSNAGQSVTFTATLTAAHAGATAPTGTVTFFKFGAGESCTAPGSATALATDASAPYEYTTSALLAGSHTITACYGGDGNYDPGSASVTHVVSINATTTTLTSSPNPSVTGESVTLTATLKRSSDGALLPNIGQVNLKTGGTSCADAAFLAGPYNTDALGKVVTTQAFPASGGNVVVRACFSGITGLLDASAGSVTQVVNKANTTTVLTVAPATTTYGDQVTLTAVISVSSPGAGTPTGSVTFYESLGADNSCAAPNGNALGSDAVASGQASIQTTLIGAGNYPAIAACYGGDAELNGSHGTDDLTVDKKTLAVTASSGTKTYGQGFTVTASYSGFVNGDDATDINTPPSCMSAGTAANAPVSGSPYATTCSGGSDDDYDFSFTPGSLTIDPADLTITASSGTKQFGQTYTVTPSYSPFQNGETPATALTTLPTCTSTGSAAGATVAGSPYATTCIGAVAANGNYDIDYVAGSLTVTAATTTLTLAPPVTTQYSDKIELSASVAPLTLEGQTQSGSVEFFIGGSSVGSAAINSSGTATKLDIPNTRQPGDYDVTATFTSSNANFGNDSDGPKTLTISKENATVAAASGNVGAIPVAQANVTLNFNVTESNPEPFPTPDPNNRRAPGDIDYVTNISAQLNGVAGGGNYNGTCSATGPATGTGYARTKPFTCTFTGPFAVDAYTIVLGVTSNYYKAADEDVLSVYDPAAGFVTGGGKFIHADGDRVSFGMSFTYTGKGKTGFRGGWVIVKHHVGGGSCRVKSNTMNAPSVNGTTASLSGKSNYSCVDANGVAVPGTGAGNLSVTGYVEDNGTSGAGQDKFWVRAFGELLMSTPAATNARTLTGGNIQVPQPSSK